jgi:hypothetical protein
MSLRFVSVLLSREKKMWVCTEIGEKEERVYCREGSVRTEN